ncbi:MAG: electron transport complex subunit RsxG [Gammaproteobacteria bacterium]|nr:MAG: electron transport complex subunit RsxG [Gammaproteobacteria bacterium]
MQMTDSIRRNAILLALFSVITAGGIAATYISTRDMIIANKRAVEEATLLELVPRDTHNNSMLDDAFTVEDLAFLGLDSPGKAYRAKRDGQAVAVILPVVAPDGYSGKIRLMVGVWADGTLAGVRAIEHHETPGLGDKVELKKSRWVLGFNGKSLDNPSPDLWKVKKDKGVFDQFTGATITPRAVTAATFRTLQYVDTHRDTLFVADQPVATEEPAP